MRSSWQRLVCGESHAEVKKDILINLDKFLDDPGLLRSPYEIKCIVSSAAFDLFTAAVNGKNVQVTAENCLELASLSKELGFHGLDDDINFARADHGDGQMGMCVLKRFQRIEKTVEWLQSITVNDLSLRVQAVEDALRDLDPVNVMNAMAGNVSIVEKHATDQPKCNTAETKIMAKEAIEGDHKRRKRDVSDLKERIEKTVVDKKEETIEEEDDECPSDGEVEMPGIFKLLRRMCRGNLHECGVVTVKVSSTRSDGKPYRVMDRNWSKHWCSDNLENSWIMFRFEKIVVCPVMYRLRIGKCFAYMAKWQVAGSNDGITWKIIDERDTDELCGSTEQADNKLHRFSCNPENDSFRLIRILQTGRYRFNGKEECYNMYLSEVEFMGSIAHCAGNYG